MEQETKSVRIGLADNRTEKQKWEDTWLDVHKHEPNNRQKRRRMEREWEKFYLQNKVKI